MKSLDEEVGEPTKQDEEEEDTQPPFPHPYT
jgi:hypothetical protein